MSTLVDKGVKTVEVGALIAAGPTVGVLVAVVRQSWRNDERSKFLYAVLALGILLMLVGSVMVIIGSL